MGRVPDLVSVVVPSYNPGPALLEQLRALECQTYSGPYEVILADDGSTDGSRAVAAELSRASRRLKLLAAAAGRRGPGGARNRGAHQARGDLLAFCDADDVVSPNWLETLVSSAAAADLVGGRFESRQLNSPEVCACFQLTDPQRPHLGFLPASAGGNLGIWADAFVRLGGFDERSRTGEDVDLVWRAQLSGLRYGVSDALVHKRLPSGLRDTARRFFGYGRGDAWLYRRYGSAGMPRRSGREALELWRWLLTGFSRAPTDQRRWLWVINGALCCGRLAGSARCRVMFP